MSSVDAERWFSFLNAGLVLPSLVDVPDETQWFSDVPGSDGTTVRLVKKAAVPPIGSPPFTVEYAIEILVPSVPTDAIGGEQALFPVAIREWGPWDMTSGGSPVAEIPNGVTITPAKWDFVLP